MNAPLDPGEAGNRRCRSLSAAVADGPLNVLLIDDDRQALYDTEKLLCAKGDGRPPVASRRSDNLSGRPPADAPRRGYRISSCTQAAEAIARVSRSVEVRRFFDVAIIDVDPQSDIGGLETVLRIRELDPGLYLVLISDPSLAAGPPVLDWDLAGGRVGYLDKPLRGRELRFMVEAFGRARRGEQGREVVGQRPCARSGELLVHLHADGTVTESDARRMQRAVPLLLTVRLGDDRYGLAREPDRSDLSDVLKRLASDGQKQTRAVFPVRNGAGKVCCLFLVTPCRLEAGASDVPTFDLRILDLVDGWPPIAGRRSLTAAEKTVALGLASGIAPRDLAGAIGIAYATLKVHRRNLYQKLGVGRQVELMALLQGAPRPSGGHPNGGTGPEY